MVQYFPKSSKKIDKIGKILGEFSKVGAWNQALLFTGQTCFSSQFFFNIPKVSA